MRAHVFQHVPFEYIGNIEPWLTEREYWITRTRFFEDPAMPPPGDVDLLIIMGGPMGVGDEAEYPWLKDEKWAIRQYLDYGVPVIGICLGAQLMAAACGARVYAGEKREIGWFPCEGVANERFAFPEEFDAFHWHGDTFDLPEEATLLASSAGCRNQAFLIREKSFGLQCHLETTRESAAALVEHCGSEMTRGPFVQDAATVLNRPDRDYEKVAQQMARVLEFATR